MKGNAASIFEAGLPSSDRPRPRRVEPERARSTLAAAPVLSIARHAGAAPPQPAKHQTSPSLERNITVIIEAAPRADETAEVAFRRKEEALRKLFATLSILESRALHRRLSLARSTDPLVKTFARMVVERRNRLLAFLADARRREAIASAKEIGR